MGDLGQWMRSRTSSRPVTPLDDPTRYIETPEADYQVQINRTGTRPTAANNTRRAPQGRISSFLQSRRSSFCHGPFDEEFVPINLKDDVYNPDPDQMAHTLMTAAMTRTGKSLPAEYSSFLLHVLEEYRSQKSTISEHRVKLANEKEARAAAQDEADRLSAKLADSLDLYERELKRLEVHISKGRNGMASLARARAGTLLSKEGRRHRTPKRGEDQAPKKTVRLDSEVDEFSYDDDADAASSYFERKDRRASDFFIKNGDTTELPVSSRPPTANDAAGFASLRRNGSLQSLVFEESLPTKDYDDLEAGVDNEDARSEIIDIQQPAAAVKGPEDLSSETLINASKKADRGGNHIMTHSLKEEMAFALMCQEANIPTTLSPSGESFGTSSITEGELLLMKHRAAPSPTLTDILDPPRRVTTVIHLNENNSIPISINNKAGLGHRRGFSFNPGDDADPTTLRHASLKVHPVELCIEDNPSSAACTISQISASGSQPPSPPAPNEGRRSVSPGNNPLRLLGKKTDENSSPKTQPARIASDGCTGTARRLSAESIVKTSPVTCTTGTSGKSRSASRRRADPDAIAAARAVSGPSKSRERSPLSVGSSAKMV